MYYLVKLAVVLVILYMKLNDLSAIPLIEYNKIAINGDDNDDNYGNNNTTRFNTHATGHTKDTTTTLNTTSINADFVHVDDNTPGALTNGSVTYDKHNRGDSEGVSVVGSHQYNASQLALHSSTVWSIPGNSTSIDFTHKLIENGSRYYSYDIFDTDNANTKATTEQTHYSSPTSTSAMSANVVHTQTNPLATNESSSLRKSILKTGGEEMQLNHFEGDFVQNKNWLFSFNGSDVERYLTKGSKNDSACLMDNVKDFMIWWSFANGSLRQPHTNFTTINSFLDLSFRNVTQDYNLYLKTRALNIIQRGLILAFSAAHNHLAHVPIRTLSLMRDSLKLLTLKGNKFIAHTKGQSKDGVAWDTFPYMPALIELDISNCHIEQITALAFRNLTSLRKLYMSHNPLLTIPCDTFQHVAALQYLDLSHTNMLDFEYRASPTLEVVINMIYGLKIPPLTFSYLPELEYLDLSHTRLTRNSAVALTHLADKLKYMSLCYTSLPMISNALFNNTALVGLDLSGNPNAGNNIADDAFENVADTLMFLYFEHSNIKNLSWLKGLRHVTVLGLTGNNINSVATDTFSPLQSLQLLDLGFNYIGNWYNRAFVNNTQLRVLNMRHNNINIITSEMLKDFELLDYLGLAENNFVCHCILRDLVDISATNYKDAECSGQAQPDSEEVVTNSMRGVDSFISPKITQLAAREYQILSSLDFFNMLMSRYKPKLLRKNRGIKNLAQTKRTIKMRFLSLSSSAGRAPKPEPYAHCPQFQPLQLYDKLNSSSLRFQLIDYEDEHYWCFNETERIHFEQLNCQARLYLDNFPQQLHKLTKYLIGSLSTLLGLLLLGVLIYFKRWHIYYYYSSLRSAALVSVASKESVDRFNILTESEPNLVYDIFISYCQNDRQWVLDELLPNVEEAGDVSICMHERDFQIGLTILDNIISCMDRSRALMLIISSSFLLSHWCQFEMHLAQHRIFEVSKEHLILVFLEDIPRVKRPKTLQYLMEVKTYIKWPVGKGSKQAQPEERKLFWKRLKRSLQSSGLVPVESSA